MQSIVNAHLAHASGRFAAAQATGRPEPTAGLAALDCVGAVVTVRREATLFREGDDARYYFKVVSGALRSCRLLPDGRRHIGDFYLAGDFIALDQGKSYLFTVEAVTEATVMRYVRDRVERLMGEQPRLATSAFAVLCDKLSTAHEHLLQLSRMTAIERVASFLLMMAGRQGNGDRVTLPMTRADIGDYLGLTIETVSRSLGQLKAAHIIALKGPGEILIRDRASLESIASGS